MSVQIRRLSYNLGAEVMGVDIREPLDDKTFDEIHTAFLQYGVLVFRGRPLTRRQHVEFSRRFGQVDDKEALIDGGDPEFPEIMVNRPELNSKLSDYVGEYWHTDQPSRLNPPLATVLHGVEIPDIGGDTMFANMYLGYETLSDGMKKLIEGLHGIHLSAIPGKRARVGGMENNYPPVAQPVVRVHPETRRKALYIESKVKKLVGMTAEESKPLIEFLCSHATRPQFVYRHVWQKHDLVIWDDRCLLHHALGDYDRSKVRHMERTIVRGTPSGYVYGGPVQ